MAKPSNQQIIAETVERVRFKHHPTWSRDELLTHPLEAMELCEAVRFRLRRIHLTDHEILWAYLNELKRGRLTNLVIQSAAPSRRRRLSRT